MQSCRIAFCLVGIVLVAGCGDQSIHPAERRAVGRLRAVGARKVKTDNEGHVRSIAVEGPRVTPEALSHLAELTYVEELDLSAAPLPAQSLEPVARLKRLRRLDLTGFSSKQPADDASLEHVAQLPQLEALILTSTNITDAGLEKLSRVTSLERLFLASTKVTDEGLAHLASLENLRVLNTEGTAVTTEGRERLAQQLPKLGSQKSSGQPSNEPATAVQGDDSGTQEPLSGGESSQGDNPGGLETPTEMRQNTPEFRE